jgi:hypothetical protein
LSGKLCRERESERESEREREILLRMDLNVMDSFRGFEIYSGKFGEEKGRGGR